MINKNFKILLFLFLYSLQLGAVPITPGSIKSLLSDNKENFHFLNVVLSNFSPPRSKQIVSRESEKHSKISFSNYISLFNEANEKDLEGNYLYFMGQKKASFEALKQAQKNFREIFEYSHNRYIEETKGLIRYAAIKVIRSGDKQAVGILQKAYNELRRSEEKFMLGKNVAPYLVRHKIKLFKEGIELARKSRKFVLDSLIEYKILKQDKEEYNMQIPLVPKGYHSSLNEKFKINEYEKIKFTLQTYIENRIVRQHIPVSSLDSSKTEKEPKKQEDRKTLDILEVHDDNFGIVTYGRDPILEDSTKSLISDKGFEIDTLKSEEPPPKTEETNQNDNVKKDTFDNKEDKNLESEKSDGSKIKENKEK